MTATLPLRFLSIMALAVLLALVHPGDAFCCHPRCQRADAAQKSRQLHRPGTAQLSAGTSGSDDGSDGVNNNDTDEPWQPPPRREATIRLAKSGREATLVSRTVPIHPGFSVTVWEWKNPSELVNAYWESAAAALDPFGLVSWPGSVVAARELCRNYEEAVYGRSVVVLGAGVGVEAQAAAMLGAGRVTATDVHPTTLQQLELGVARNEELSGSKAESVVSTEILDLYKTKDEQPIPSPCDLLVVADVLYNEELATQVCRRCAEALEANPEVRILVTDSQRFVPEFIDELNEALAKVAPSTPPVAWKVEILKSFEGSGVIIEEDQTYDVTVQSLWIGLQ